MKRSGHQRSTARRAAAVAALLGVLVVTALAGVTIALAAPAPATPTLTATPPNPSASTSASFSFTGEAGSTFECRLDTAAYAACTSPRSYSALTLASHTFRVRALKGGKTSGERVYTWSVAAPATPTIGTKPANPTNATSETFSFTTNASNATFECKLDAGSFAACTSGITYPGPLSATSHTFQVRALGVAGSSTGTSSAASYTWTVDTTPPPAPAIDTGPASPTNSTSAAYTFSDSEAGVSFLCRLDATAFAACTSPKSYSGLGQGAHSFQVKARDAAGNESAPASRSWTIDLTPPPVPVITSAPPDPSSQAESTFEFTDAESPVSFQCSIENGPYGPCSSPITFTVIVDSSNNGQHQFAVRAVDPAGNVSGSASYRWKVTNVGFTITGDAAGLLYPGVWRQLPLQLVNPHNFTIFVESIVVSVSSAPGGCGAANIEFVQSNASTASPVTVPANSTAAVPAAKQPQIRLRNLPTNQDTCKNVSFSLSYSGTATK
jgi:large repetitive protein